MTTWAQSPAAKVPDHIATNRVLLATEIAVRAKRWAQACADSEKAAAARGALDAGSSRAKVTTVNARWSVKAEHRDRCERDLVLALRTAGLAP